MRKLTQNEIDNAPEWATHYGVIEFDHIMWRSKYLGSINNSGQLPFYCYGIPEHCTKPIPRKEFDISDYESCDPNVDYIEAQEFCIRTVFEDDINEYIENRDDVIAKAKHFKLTPGELK